MDSLSNEIHGEIENDEEFPEEFQCFVCLDLVYKPVILACGHMACFWCIYKSMDFAQDSRCPVCRNPYGHFPSICTLLHFLLLKLYPLAYGRRAKQVAEEENRCGDMSPQLDDYSSNLNSTGGFAIQSASSLDVMSISHESNSLVEREPPLSEPSSPTLPDENCRMTVPPILRKEAVGNWACQDYRSIKDGFEKGTIKGVSKQEMMTDVLCAVCKQLLYRPVVLNCGHVHCEDCIMNSIDESLKCPVCQMPHPTGIPNVCLILNHFLEEQYPEEYVARKLSSHGQIDRHNKSVPEGSRKVPKKGSVNSYNYYLWLTGEGPQVHIGVGCDYCGMCPIVGERYKCKDCTEKIGFDLCEGCYNSSSKRPARFNQQHRPEHKFETVQPFRVQDVILRLGTETHEDDDHISINPEDLVDDASVDPPHDPCEDRDGDN